MVNLSARFKKRCSSIYSGMKSRTAEKRDKNQRIIRHGQDLPFSQAEFTAWFLSQFNGSEHGVARCCYCNRPIDAFSCRVDHAVPLRRGGAAGQENLCVTCDVCNDVKSKLTPDEFRWFMDRMSEMSLKFGREPVSDITSRLQKAVGLAGSLAWARAKAAKAPQQPETF